MTKEELDAEGCKVGGMDQLVHVLAQFVQHKEISDTSLGKELAECLASKQCLYTFFENHGESVFPGESAPGYYVYLQKEDYDKYDEHDEGDEDSPSPESLLDEQRVEVTYGYYAGHCAGEGYSLIFEKAPGNTFTLSPHQDSRWLIH